MSKTRSIMTAVFLVAVCPVFAQDQETFSKLEDQVRQKHPEYDVLLLNDKENLIQEALRDFYQSHGKSFMAETTALEFLHLKQGNGSRLTPSE